MPTSLRPFRPADTDRIVELALAAWAPVFASFREILGEELYSRVHPDWLTDQAASVRDALERHDTWVAVTDETVTGFVTVIFTADERSGEIYMIAVDPAAQRQGIASQLTELALDEMRARGIDLAIVATGGDKGHAPARATYEKAGFTGAPQVWFAKVLPTTPTEPRSEARASAPDPAQSSMPACARLGIHTLEATPERVTLAVDWTPELCTVADLLHGGVVMTLADSAGAMCAYLNLPEGAAGTSTIQSSTNFIGAVRAGTVEATATAIHTGRTTIVVTTQVHNDGRLVATTTQTQSVLRPAADAARQP